MCGTARKASVRVRLAPGARLADDADMTTATRSTRSAAALLAALLLALPGCRDHATGSAAPPPNAATAIAVPSGSAPPSTAVVIASVSGVEPGGEPVEAALQTQAQWGTDEAAYRARVEAEAASVALRFDGVAPGRYALVAVQPAIAPRVGVPDGSDGADRESAANNAPPSTVSLVPVRGGGWTASGAEARRPPAWEGAGIAVTPDGAIIPLTLARR